MFRSLHKDELKQNNKIGVLVQNKLKDSTRVHKPLFIDEAFAISILSFTTHEIQKEINFFHCL